MRGGGREMEVKYKGKLLDNYASYEDFIKGKKRRKRRCKE